MAEDPLAAFPVVVTIPVQWGDMDALRHVNNVVYLRWFEAARIAYFEKTAVLAGDSGAVGPILASQTCRYKAPLTYPDTVRVGTRIADLGEDRFTMLFAIASERLGRIAAEGEGLVVSYDYTALKKAPLPPAWRDAIARIEGRG
jgi:acyl-CoA thioester hydrolase